MLCSWKKPNHKTCHVFLTFRKGAADPDIPILKEAKAQYAKVQ
jgi:hypothetical protein